MVYSPFDLSRYRFFSWLRVSFFGFEARCGRPENQYHISDSGRVGAYALVKLLGSGVQDVGSGALPEER